METEANMIVHYVKRGWTRVREYLQSRADQHVSAWGSALQYKRRYTDPESAKAYRTPVEHVRMSKRYF